MATCDRPDAIVGDDRRRGAEVFRHVEIDQPVEPLRDRLLELPADAKDDRQVLADAEVVVEIGVVRPRTESLVGIPVGDGAGVRQAEQEVGKGSPLNEPLKVNDPRAFCWEIESII